MANAFEKLTKDWEGAEYEPLMYAAHQVIAGVNYMILCRETIMDKDSTVVLSTMTITVPVNEEPRIFAVNRLF